MKNPILYQGKNKKRNYFEGWYFKFVNKDMDRVFAVIPGVSKNVKDPHCFIQINDSAGNTEYFRFDINDFKFSKSDRLEITIKNNFFSIDKVNLDLPNIKAEFCITENSKYKGMWPNIMGPFSFIPFMQCYHGVVSLNNTINGKLTINNKIISFDSGKGYIEKDWGTGFPKDWIWLQGNSFKEEQNSIMLSLAHIPWFGLYFPGFLGFLKVNNKTYYFSTYNLSKVTKIIIGDHVEIQIRKRKYELNIKVQSVTSGVLMAPVNGTMNRSIKESIDAKIDVELLKKGQLIYRGTTNAAGLEVVGEVDELFKLSSARPK